MSRFKKYLRLAIPFVLALGTFILTLIFKNNPSLTEKVYSTGIYPKVAYALSNFSALFPLSLDDVFYVLLVFSFFTSVFLVLIKRLTLKLFILRLLQSIALLYSAFYFLWGFNYFRESAHHRTGLNKTEASTENFVEVFKQIANCTNEAYISWHGQDTVNFQSVLEPSIQELQEFLSVDYPNGVRRVKKIVFSDFFAKASILGYYGPFFNEVHVNNHLSVWDIPVVTAHEMSHQLGITQEAEANFYAWLITVNSNNKFANYSGWLYALGFFIYQSRGVLTKEELVSMIRPEVIDDYKLRRQHWQKFRSETINNAARKVNDVYLKSNNVEKGVEDYGGVVQLIIDFYLSENKEIIF